MDIEVSNPKITGPYHVSKWLNYKILVTKDELEKLFDEIEAVEFFCLSEVGVFSDLLLSKAQYLNLYEKYLRSMQTSDQERLKQLTKQLSVAIVYEPSAFYQIPVDEKKVLIKLKKPTIQIKPFNFIYNNELGVFLENIRSNTSIYFGLDISFPQVFKDPETLEIRQVFKEQKFQGAKAFKKLRSFIRENTQPARFQIENKVKVATFRIGKKCGNFAKSYEQLEKEGLTITGV